MWEKEWLRKSLLLGTLALVALGWTYSKVGSRALFGREILGIADLKGGEFAPEFPANLAWLNTQDPLTLKGLRGKVVLLDFWTFCCINCMHVLPDLARLEEKYKDELVILGVHSAKFSNEQSTQKIRQAVLRYGISHPVLNDRGFDVWDAYDVKAWPTFVLIDPQGRIVGKISGEGLYSALDRAIAGVIRNSEKSGHLKRGAFVNRLERASAKKSLLAFPGKVLADPKGGRLFVADSNHNRIVVASLKDGSVQELFEGPLRNPQGLALSQDGMTLYVADTGAHAVRSIDLKGRTIGTLAEKLRSPWDLTLLDGALYVAMAGSHQVWRLDLKSGKIGPYAGSGRENIKDGPLKDSELAQPSGLTTDGSRLFVADSETSAIRVIDGGKVGSLVGRGLFDFGNIDGDRAKARLQHPLGVSYHKGVLYVADTYNNKIKVVDPVSGGAKSLLGNGLAEFKDGKGREARFDEPGGLWADGGKLYVADTNNHAIRVVDLKSAEVSTFRFKGLK